MKIKNISKILLPILLISLTLVSAQNIRLTKTVPDEIKLGDILEVTIIVENLLDNELGVQVREVIGGAEPVDPPEFEKITIPDCKFCAVPPFYSWEIKLDPKVSEIINYKIRPVHPGRFILSPTVVTTSDGETYRTESVSTHVRCNGNGICEVDLVENHFSCPEDCPSGSEDNTCDLISDDICDPDCSDGADEDCKSKLISNWWIYALLLVLMVLVIVLILLRK